MTDSRSREARRARRSTPSFAVEQNTRNIQRTLLEGVASCSSDQIVSMVARARRRGASYATIARWFGPRASCPPRLHAILDRVSLLAAVEAR